MGGLISSQSAQVGDWMGRLGGLLKSEIDSVYAAQWGQAQRYALE